MEVSWMRAIRIEKIIMVKLIAELDVCLICKQNFFRGGIQHLPIGIDLIF